MSLYQELIPFFEPKSIAVVGASEKLGTLGRGLMLNLLEKFRGKIYPVNIKYDRVFGLTCYKSVKEIPGEVDLAVIAIPARAVINVAKDCCDKGIKALLIISAGFKEIGPEGAEREKRLVEIARSCNMRIVGPNCLGIYDAHTGLDTIYNPSDRQGKPKPGNVAFISQSGALGAAMLDWLAGSGVGLSRFISYGNAADVDETDLIEFLVEDPKTKIISAYIEGVKDGRRFMNAIRKAVKAGKPVVILKAGKTMRGIKAVTSHTGSLAGKYEIYEAALKQSGALIVNELWELVPLLKALSWLPIPRGNRLAIVTNGGGAGILATDATEKLGLIMTNLNSETIEKLKKSLPPHASPYNPVDIIGDATAERYEKALEIVCQDENVDMIVIIALMQSPTLDADKLRKVLIEFKKKVDKPVVFVAPGGDYTEKHSRAIEQEAKIPVFKSPEEAIRALKYLVIWKERYERIIKES